MQEDKQFLLQPFWEKVGRDYRQMNLTNHVAPFEGNNIRGYY